MNETDEQLRERITSSFPRRNPHPKALLIEILTQKCKRWAVQVSHKEKDSAKAYIPADQIDDVKLILDNSIPVNYFVTCLDIDLIK